MIGDTQHTLGMYVLGLLAERERVADGFNCVMLGNYAWPWSVSPGKSRCVTRVSCGANVSGGTYEPGREVSENCPMSVV